MKFKVVNIRASTYDVYIGRAGRGQDGFWGNPVVIGKKCPECGKTHTDGGSTLLCYTRYLIRRLEDPEFRTRFNNLREVAKVREVKLGCFCKPSPCHGDVMVEFLLGNV